MFMEPHARRTGTSSSWWPATSVRPPRRHTIRLPQSADPWPSTRTTSRTSSPFSSSCSYPANCPFWPRARMANGMGFGRQPQRARWPDPFSLRRHRTMTGHARRARTSRAPGVAGRSTRTRSLGAPIGQARMTRRVPDATNPSPPAGRTGPTPLRQIECRSVSTEAGVPQRVKVGVKVVRTSGSRWCVAPAWRWPARSRASRPAPARVVGSRGGTGTADAVAGTPLAGLGLYELQA